MFQAIKMRRSIRRYKCQPVPPDLLEKVLEAARQAPSWANTQTWRFVVVSDEAFRQRLAQIFPMNRAAESVRQAPIAVVSCAELGKSGCLRGQWVSDKAWHLFDLGGALQNLSLAAHALGLATVHIGNFEPAPVKELLSVPAGFEVEVITALGYPDEEPTPTSRKSLAEIAFGNRFGETL